MHGQKRTMNSYPESMELDHESVTHNTSTNEQTSWNILFSSPENRSPSSIISSDEANFMHGNNVGHDSRNFRAWALGESSSSADPQGKVNADSSIMEHALSSYNAGTSENMDINVGKNGNSMQDIETGVSLNLGKSGIQEAERKSPASLSFRKVGSSSETVGSGSEGNGVGSTSLGIWGSSSKRKTLEGTSGSGSSGTDTTIEHNGVGMTDTVNHIPPLSLQERSESSVRSVDRRVNSGHQQYSSPFASSSSRGNSRHFNFHGLVRIPSSRNEHPIPWDEASVSRYGSSSRSVDPSGDTNRALREQENAILENMRRDNAQYPMFSHGGDTRYLVQDPTNWSLATGNIRPPSRDVPSSSRVEPDTSAGPSNSMWASWNPPPNPQTHTNQQRLSGFSPWTLFPSSASEPGGRRATFRPLSPATSVSSEENMISSEPRSQAHRPVRLGTIERQGDDILGMAQSLRALAADIEGRESLITEIRQVLSAMRRGENIRPEDYMLFDPVIFHEMHEFHDRHRDMRLDVDNMSYEELLALGDRIGDVKTGLSEETILKLIKQTNYTFIETSNPNTMEPCCVCQEEYVAGDDLGTLDCGHDFHTNCIKQWLMEKNICPICKTTALLDK